MSKVVIIADDLTGANATSVLLAEQGFKAMTFIELTRYNPDEFADLDVICISTDSRGVERDLAYRRVREVAGFFEQQDVALFCKRVDSTLRGNIGAEIDAVLSALPAETIAVVVPVFPSSGRICLGDYLLVNGVPLERTDVAKDPKTPVSSSKVTEIIALTTQLSVGHLELDLVMQGRDCIKAALLDHAQAGVRIVVVDAVTDEDILEIARAVKTSNLQVISVDPGPFTATLACKLLDSVGRTHRKVLCVIGSVTNLTRQQVRELRAGDSVFFAEIDAEKLLRASSRQVEIERAAAQLAANLDRHDVLGIISSCGEGDILDLKSIAGEMGRTEDEISQMIADGIATTARLVFEQNRGAIGGLFTTGGDITVGVCNKLEAAGIEVLDEVLPLAVCGRLKSGAFDGTSIVTKGGLIGDKRAIIDCVDYLLQKDLD